jgi:hypothetical protein
MRSARLTAGLGAMVVVLALAGCTQDPAGQDVAGSEVPTAASSQRGTNVVDESQLSSARDAYDLKVAQCLRDKGFDVKDPQPGEGISEEGPGIREAASVCMKGLGDPPTMEFTEQNIDEMLTTQLTWADCLRGLGYEVQEPRREQAFVMPEDVDENDVPKCIK